MEMDMFWTGLLDENFSSLRGMLDEGEGEDDLYSTIDANGGTLQALLGSSPICPNGALFSNVGGTVNAFHHFDCSITTSADTPDPEGSDELGLLHRRDGIESGLHENGGKQKLKGVIAEREADAHHAANNNNNNGYANAASVGLARKNGFCAKNLMAERRRRKKLNDRLFMLRSVVPKVSKMDRTSTLADAVDYLKELLQRINDLHTELMSGSSNLALTLPDFSWRKKQEYQASLLNQELRTTKVEVRTREGKALNIHMFCSRKPDLLLSTIRALDGLGLELKQAAISCLNGFSLDIFQAEQSMGFNVTAEDIKALLLHTGGYVTGM